MTIRQISVFVENNTGKLAEITEILGKNNIDLRAVSIADTSNFGVLRMIVDNPDKALSVLKDADYIVNVTSVIGVSLNDSPGSLANVLRVFTENKISIEYLYAFVSHRQNNAYLIIQTENNEDAVKVLSENGIQVASQDEIDKL